MGSEVDDAATRTAKHATGATSAKGLAFLSPWIIGFLVFTITPILLSIYFSLCDYSLLEPPVSVGLQNYRDLVRDQWFWQRDAEHRRSTR